MKENYITCKTLYDIKQYIKVGSKIILIGRLGQSINAIYLCLDYSESIINYIGEDNKRYIISISEIKEIQVLKEENKTSKKEQLLKELEQIRKQQNKLSEELQNIQRQIELEDNKKKWWFPRVNELYWIVGKNKLSQRIPNRNSINDRIRMKNYNCFKTKEQADRKAFEEQLHNKLQAFAYENNNEADWSNDNTKYNIWYDYKKHDLYTGCDEFERYFGQSYFESREIAEKAIEEFKADLIRYFTSDK